MPPVARTGIFMKTVAFRDGAQIPAEDAVNPPLFFLFSFDCFIVFLFPCSNVFPFLLTSEFLVLLFSLSG
ncbi:MAG TPA: hypothetical protein DE060_18935 [Lentisphaeria bacterium]|nr:hypothetical protein [Lentisphaeria bacterium]HCG51266.1 hypothetical protein [Lentisphaeria bacterium]